MKAAWAFLFLVFQVFSEAQPSTTAVSLSEALINYLTARNKIAPLNAAVIVSRGTKIITKQYFGRSNAATSEPITATTTFLIASATKPFTATAIMLLADRGKLSLSDPLSKWIADAPEPWSTVTLKHLLSHTSGIIDFVTLKGGQALQPNLKSLLLLYKGHPLQFKPGSKFAYSNTNFMLLSYVIEKCSGATYETFLQSQIFDPLQMNHTGFAYPKVPITLAHGYRSVFKMDTLSKEEKANLAVLKGAGGMYSTAQDLVTFLSNFSKLMSKQALDTMLKPVTGEYALGWHVQHQFGKVTIKHPGSINGFTAEMRWVAADSTGVVILSNSRFNDLNIRYASFDMMKLMNGVVPGAELAVNPDYLGKYSLPEKMVSRFKSSFIELIESKGQLVLSVSGSTRYLIPADKGRFFFYGEPVDVEFKDNGKLLRILSPSLGQIECVKMQ